MFIRFDMNVTDRQTDGRTDRQTPHDGIGRACDNKDGPIACCQTTYRASTIIRHYFDWRRSILSVN